MRSVTRGLITAASAAVLALAWLPASAGASPGPINHTGATPASANPYSPAYGHPYRHGAIPTRDRQAQMKQWQAQNAITATNTLYYGGGIDGIGVTSGHPKVYLVFYGNQWGSQSTNSSGDLTFSGDPSGGAPVAQEMFKGIGTGGEQWSGTMTQYCDGSGVATGASTCPAGAAHVPYPTGGVLSGVWYDNSVAAPQTASGHQLGAEALSAAHHFGNTTAASNRYAYYVILSPHNTNPDSYQGQYCAWHDYNGDSTLTGGAVSSDVGDFAFSNQPYNMDSGAGCGVGFINSPGTLDGWTMTLGHEYAETITDQNPPGGWTATSGYENADECAWLSSGQGHAANVTFGTGTFAQQGSWSNDTNRCDLTHPDVSGGGSTGGVTVANPGSKTGTVGTATSQQMTASGGTTPYHWSATGLPAGLSINASTGLISGTPTTATTYNVTVTATDSSSPAKSGTASFGWTINPSGGGGCTGSGQKLGNPGFESGNTVWSASSGVIGQYGSSGEPTHSGTWNAWLDGYGSTHTDTVSQSVTIPSGCHATLSFYLHIDSSETTTTTAYDKVTVTIGSTTLATYSNLNKASGYTLRSFDVSSFAGQTVTVKFTGTEDSSLQTSFVVDDTALNAS